MKTKKQAKKFIRQILEFYAAVNIEIALDFVHASDGLFVLQIGFMPGTTEKKIRQYLGDVQQALGLELFQLHRERMNLFFVVAEHNIFDNRLLGILTSPSYAEHTKNMVIPYAIGFNVMRRPVVVDLATYVHWLLGGSSASGKTVGVKCLVTSVAYSCSPENVNLIILDGASNLTQFDGLPHLSCPVIQDSDTGFLAIKAGYEEMEERIALKNDDIEAFNRLPHIIYVLDEFVSFVLGIGDKMMSGLLPDTISQLLRRGRHAKMHVVLTAQDPLIKDMKTDVSNATARLAFTCAKPHYSVTILGEGGAEKLFGNGEMYFKSPKHSGLQYVKGAYVTPDEIGMVSEYICAKYIEAKWDDSCKFNIDIEALREVILAEAIADDSLADISVAADRKTEDKLFAKIIMWTLGRETVSGNAINQAFNNIGQRKARRLLERLYTWGIAGDANIKQGREVLTVCIEDLSDEVLRFLNNYGYTEEPICEVFSSKLGVVNVVTNGGDDDE
ncbi:MAG: FtsK/SpoIIIE domain-containing protein [Defluviitaleaceae bacterium]|nr:FtsK/SpoIIIE domain-containing protein [Defluviitaleaceae bacterium]